ncbi:MAG: VanZ family protein [Butyricicoccus pullicaecorum]|nr:VanZ family protein [Butyricicoccus pullicaecorum]
MSDSLKQISTWLWRLACALFLAFNVYAEHSGQFLIHPPLKIALAVCFIALLTLAVRPSGSRGRYRVWLWLLFAYYVWVLANMLFFDAAFGRGMGGGGVNLEPLHTIRSYLLVYERGNYPLDIIFINLAGNLAAFAPMAVFLPALFRSQRNILVFFVTIVLLVAAVEAVQLVTGTGSCDVDDLILNTAGAMAVWIVLLPWRLWACYKEGKP